MQVSTMYDTLLSDKGYAITEMIGDNTDINIGINKSLVPTECLFLLLIFKLIKHRP